MQSTGNDAGMKLKKVLGECRGRLGLDLLLISCVSGPKISSLSHYWRRLGRIMRGKLETFEKIVTITTKISHPCGACALTSC